MEKVPLKMLLSSLVTLNGRWFIFQKITMEIQFLHFGWQILLKVLSVEEAQLRALILASTTVDFILHGRQIGIRMI